MKDKIISGLKWFFKSFIWLFIVLLGLDILTKQLILHAETAPGSVISDWGFVHISYVLNRGAAFGIGTGNETANRIIYLIVASLISIAIAAYLIIKRKETKLFMRASLILVITGAIGNVIDRVFYGPLQGAEGLFSGAVVDWIDFYWFWGYVFNIADCCIVIAAFMMIIYIIVLEVKEMIERRNAEVKMKKDVIEEDKMPENSENKESE